MKIFSDKKTKLHHIVTKQALNKSRCLGKHLKILLAEEKQLKWPLSKSIYLVKKTLESYDQGQISQLGYFK